MMSVLARCTIFSIWFVLSCSLVLLAMAGLFLASELLVHPRIAGVMLCPSRNFEFEGENFRRLKVALSRPVTVVGLSSSELSSRNFVFRRLKGALSRPLTVI